MKKIIALIAGVFIGSGAFAQHHMTSRTRSSYILGALGWSQLSLEHYPSMRANTAFELGVGAQRFLGDSIPLRTQVYYANYGGGSSGASADLQGAMADATVGYAIADRYVPYIGIGTGVLLGYAMDEDTGKRRSNPAFISPYMVLGFEILTLDKAIAIGFEYKQFALTYKGNDFFGGAVDTNVNTFMFKMRYAI